MTTYGAQMDRKWTGSGLEVTGSGPEVDWKCPSVRPYVCPSQTLPLPPWQTLCEGSTSAGSLRPAIFTLGLYAKQMWIVLVNLFLELRLLSDCLDFIDFIYIPTQMAKGEVLCHLLRLHVKLQLLCSKCRRLNCNKVLTSLDLKFL